MAQSFLDVARDLIQHPEAKTDYANDPDGFLAARGLEGFSAGELDAAVGFVADALPAPVARQLAPPSPAGASPAGVSPPAAPEPAALARLAATSQVEKEVREAEPGAVDFAAVLDPGGELGVPDEVDLTTLTPTAPEEEASAGAEGTNAEQADGSGGELPESGDTDDPDLEAATPDAPPGTGEEADEGEEGFEAGEEEGSERDFDLDPGLQPTVETTIESDTGLPAGPLAEPAGMEPPPGESSDI